MQGMKESYSEDLANHTGRELCADGGNNISEALTGVCVGCVLSPESDPINPSADVVLLYGRQHCLSQYGEGYTGSAGSETTCMHRNTLHWNREALRLTLENITKVYTENPLMGARP